MVPDSLLILRGNVMGCHVNFVKVHELPFWRRCASPWAMEETPAGEGRVEGAQERAPCDSMRTSHQKGFFPSARLMTVKHVEGSTLLGDLCPYLDHSTQDVVTKHSEVMRDAKG